MPEYETINPIKQSAGRVRIALEVSLYHFIAFPFRFLVQNGLGKHALTRFISNHPGLIFKRGSRYEIGAALAPWLRAQ